MAQRELPACSTLTIKIPISQISSQRILSPLKLGIDIINEMLLELCTIESYHLARNFEQLRTDRTYSKWNLCQLFGHLLYILLF